MKLACLRCKSCRTVLVESPEDQITSYDPLESNEVPHFASSTPCIPSTSCNSYFIQQPQWLHVQYSSAPTVGLAFPVLAVGGIAPAFSLTKSKVDAIYKPEQND